MSETNEPDITDLLLEVPHHQQLMALAVGVIRRLREDNARLHDQLPKPRQWDEEHEERAKAIYDLLPYDGPGSKPAWVPHGNSRKQDEARDLARLPTPSPQ